MIGEIRQNEGARNATPVWCLKPNFVTAYAPGEKVTVNLIDQLRIHMYPPKSARKTYPWTRSRNVYVESDLCTNSVIYRNNDVM
jgi:hypothetical protein